MEGQIIWIVGQGDVEGSYTEFVCSTEALARTRFDEVRQSIIKDHLEMIEFFKNEGAEPIGYKMYDGMISYLRAVTFDSRPAERYVHSQPFWEKFPLEK